MTKHKQPPLSPAAWKLLTTLEALGEDEAMPHDKVRRAHGSSATGVLRERGLADVCEAGAFATELGCRYVWAIEALEGRHRHGNPMTASALRLILEYV